MTEERVRELIREELAKLGLQPRQPEENPAIVMMYYVAALPSCSQSEATITYTTTPPGKL